MRKFTVHSYDKDGNKTKDEYIGFDMSYEPKHLVTNLCLVLIEDTIQVYVCDSKLIPQSLINFLQTHEQHSIVLGMFSKRSLRVKT